MRLLFTYLFFAFAFAVQAQLRKNTAYLNYIKEYNELAVEQMREHGIPASITLAQGLLESGAGLSELSRRSNNHFGIKCGSAWRGKTTRHTDDRPNECFRVYKHPRASYEDHSQFLKQPRYRPLFQLNIMDYKGWARGLKSCGYATSRTYATQLIQIIETYELDRYDVEGLSKSQRKSEDVQIYIRGFATNNGVNYVRAHEGDTWKTLSRRLDISVRKLVKYNDAIKTLPIEDGDMIYLEKKKKRADKMYKRNPWHKVKAGESMHTVSQLYGIRMERLYKMNFKTVDYVPQEGDLLKIR